MKPFSNVLGKIGDFFSAIGHFLSRFFDAETSMVENVTRIYDDFLTIEANFTAGVDEIRNFKFDPRWQTRVISIPAVIPRLQDLYQRIFLDFRDRLAAIAAPIHEFHLIFTTSGESAADQQVSGLTKTAVKIDEIATLVKQIANAMDAIKDFTALFDEVVKDLETLDVIFLQQGNPRKRVDAQATIRVGKLHG